MPSSLVVKKGSKMCSRVARSIPIPVSMDREKDVRSGPHIEMLDRVRLVDHHVPGLDRHSSAVGHRVAGVDDEVDQDLVELPGIGADVTGVMVELEHEPHVFADQLTDHRLEATDGGIEVEHASG